MTNHQPKEVLENESQRSTNSVFHINRQHMPALLQALGTAEENDMAEKLVGTTYAIALLLALDAVRQTALPWIDAAKHWSPPVTIDLAQCSIDCTQYKSNPASSLHASSVLQFWFYSEDLVDWMEGYSEQFFDFAVILDADSLDIQKTLGPSR
ncbi:hypothetical protein [Paenibacillus kandeliae]|uniref:hypothetical protein n=1 Tax=Paenibacillus kandeliae TaxID=3231269 RepID=UPI00345964AB